MNRPLISVILPVYNGAQTLEAALQSITSQTYRSVELIVVDGKSTDRTPDILQTHREAITVLITETDEGIYDAINKGIRRSSGEWIYILGADDALASSDIFEKALSHVAAETRLIIGDVAYTGEKQSLVPRLHQSKWSSQLWWRNTLHQQGALYHSSLFANVQFNTRYRILGDYDFHLHLYAAGIKAEKKVITIAQCAAQGTSKRFDTKLYLEEITLKRQRLPLAIFMLNVPLIFLKYLLKQLP